MMVTLATVVATFAVFALYAYGIFDTYPREEEVFVPRSIIIEDNWFEAPEGEFGKAHKATIRHITVLRTYNVGPSIGAVVFDHSRDTKGASIIPKECVSPLMVHDLETEAPKDLTHRIAEGGGTSVVNIAKLCKWWSKPADQTPSEWRIPGDKCRSETLRLLEEREAVETRVDEASKDGDATAKHNTEVA
jgi:hypothetical protein